MVAQLESGLQTVMDALSKSENKYDMKINAKKTKVMRLCRDGLKEKETTRSIQPCMPSNFSVIFKTVTSRLTLLKRKIAAKFHFIHTMKERFQRFELYLLFVFFLVSGQIESFKAFLIILSSK